MNLAIKYDYKLLDIDLFLFDVVNKTTSSGLTAEGKTYYARKLLKYAKPNLVHNQFGQKKKIPARNGNVIEFRRWSKLPKSTTPLVEGTPPAGQALTINVITASPNQYGDYVKITDRLLNESIDAILEDTSELLATQAGETVDTLTRDIISAGTNVVFGDGASGVTARHLLVGGSATEADNDYASVKGFKNCVRVLRNASATPFGSKTGRGYVGIIHPDLEYDISEDPDFIEAKKYGDPEALFEYEIGKIGGVRIVVTPEAKVFGADNLSEGARNLTVSSVAGQTITVAEVLTTNDATALVGRYFIVNDEKYLISAATEGGAGAATIESSAAFTTTPSASDVIYPGEAGSEGRDVYSIPVIGKDAYGVIEESGMGLEMIYKPLGSAGSSDPLEQIATNGWKTMHTAKILNENWMVRMEVTSRFQAVNG